MSLPLVLMFAVDMAIASGFCAQMTDLTLQARSNFVTAPASLKTAENCRMVRSLAGGNAYHCSWKFPYRDAAAQTVFEDFNQSLRSCFAGGQEVVQDVGVNHPDSYTQHQHLTDDVVVSVSIKDKGALQETYVFVNVQGVSPK
jgi:hypothetical protein